MSKRFVVFPLFENEDGETHTEDEPSKELFESVIVSAYHERFGKFCAAHSKEENLRQRFCDQISAELLFQKWLDIACEQAGRDKALSLAGHFNGMKLGSL